MSRYGGSVLTSALQKGMCKKMPLLNQEQIKEIIPHRDPFLLIDEVLEMEPGVRVVARKHLKEDEYWFKGHFPGQPVQPGVLTIEMLAQAGAVCALSVPENKGKIAFFAGIDKAKFRGVVKPGDTLTLEVEIIKARRSIGVGKATAYVGDKRVCSAEITFAIGE
jgi:3-hydroxyacyl-[acyl-carrier-protein] dehydratase